MIRRATTDDLAAMASVHRASIMELCRVAYTSEQLERWTGELRPENYEKLFLTHACFVDDDAGRLRGFGILDLGKARINALYVAPDAARQGVGRGLVDEMERCARKHRLRELQLNATLNAVSFYEKLGYGPVERISNTLPSGLELPAVRMHKRLQPVRA